RRRRKRQERQPRGPPEARFAMMQTVRQGSAFPFVRPFGRAGTPSKSQLLLPSARVDPSRPRLRETDLGKTGVECPFLGLLVQFVHATLCRTSGIEQATRVLLRVRKKSAPEPPLTQN